MIKVIIVDDEEYARNRLTYMLSEVTNIKIVGVCKNGLEAIQEIEKKEPDLLFLDVEMPEIDGFDVLSNLETSKTPVVIFITAFSEYAVKAFEVNALDYIHKPFDKERLFKAIEKASKTIEEDDEENIRKNLEKLLNNRDNSSKKIDRFVLKSGGNIYIVKATEVLWIEASGNYINIVTEKKKHLLRGTMGGIKAKLDSDVFYQIHRSTIVNLDFVNRIEEWMYGDYKVIMDNGEELKMSRNFKDILNSFY